MSDGELRIGVVGATARIHRLALRPAMAAVAGVRLVHEGSRGGGLEERDGVRRSEGSGAYERVVADPDVDLVYVPLPNHLHEEWTVAAARAGKHVLCEKPLAVDAASAQRMADACADAGVVLVEAYMSPHHPRNAAVLDAVADGALGGPLREATARMTGTLPRDDHRFSVANGGGALLDVGIYCLEPMLTAAGWDGTSVPEVTAHARRAGDGVDEATTALLRLADGTTLSFHVDVAAPDQQHLQLTGPTAAIEVTTHATPDRRHDHYVVLDADGARRTVRTPTGDCYEGMLAHVRDVVAGRVPLARPPTRSVALARVLDAVADASGGR